MAEVELTYRLAVEFLSFLRVSIHSEPGDLNLLCLKGMEPHPARPGVLVLSDDAPDRYNDTIVMVYQEPMQVLEVPPSGRVIPLRGTVDPGMYYTRVEPHPQGAAHLTFGQHLYVKGEHKNRPALRAFQELNRIWRDKNGNFKPDEGECVYLGTFGVNIHPGGATDYIGKWSAGCINIHGGWEGASWKSLMERVDIHFQNRAVLNVTVWRGLDLWKFKEEGWAHRPSLCVGMQNPWVGEAQHLLKDKGLDVSVDNDWRTQTDKAVRQFQTSRQLTVDGWIGPETWKALLS